MTQYVLVGKRPVPCSDTAVWLKAMQSEDRIVAKNKFRNDTVEVSTVFLGFDHRISNGSPLIFETMIFGLDDGELKDYQYRYSTWEEAQAGHDKVCILVKKELENDLDRHSTCD